MWTLLGAALAGPPDGIDPDDIQRWTDAARAATAGPTGCWELTGDVEQTLSLDRAPSAFRRARSTPYTETGTFTGRLDDGVWTRLDYTSDERDESAQPSNDEDGGTIEISTGEGIQINLGDDLRPLLGRVKRDTTAGDGKDAPTTDALRTLRDGQLQQWMERWPSTGSTAWTRWRDDIGALELTESVPTEDGSDANVLRKTTFPGGVDPGRISLTLPAKFTFGEWPARVHVYNGQAHVLFRRVEDVVLPAAETWSARVAVLGFGAGYEQALTYRTATPCAAD